MILLHCGSFAIIIHSKYLYNEFLLCLIMLVICDIAQCKCYSQELIDRQQLFSVLDSLHLLDSKYLDTEGEIGLLHSEEDLEL